MRLKDALNEMKYYVTYNKGRGQGKGLEKEFDQKSFSSTDKPKVFNSYNDAKKYAEKMEKMFQHSIGGGTAYWVSDEKMNPIKESVTEEKVYIDYLNKAKGFKQDRIKFNSYEDAVKWARQNFDKFDRDMIKYESINEVTYDLGKKQYTDKNMTPTEILELAMAYAQTPVTKIVGNKHEYRVRSANDLAKLNGTTQSDVKTRGKQPALILFLLKNELVSKEEYVKLYKVLLAKQIEVIRYLKNSSPEMRNSGGAMRAAEKDGRGEFGESKVTEATSPYDRNSAILQRPGNSLFAAGVEPPMWKVVISDESGFDDASKRNRFLITIEKHLNNKKLYYDYSYDTNKIMDKLKYYPATDKFIGVLPKFLFKAGYKPSLQNCKISYEISKISPTIEIKEKK